MDELEPQPHFSPFRGDFEHWDCQTCTHSIGYDGNHLWCQREKHAKHPFCWMCLF